MEQKIGPRNKSHVCSQLTLTRLQNTHWLKGSLLKIGAGKQHPHVE